MLKNIKEITIKVIYSITGIARVVKNSKKVILPRGEGDIYVLGNGPSVKAILDKNEKFFFNKKVFCVNFIVMAEFYDKLRPQYYVLCDPAFFDDNVSSDLKRKKEKFIINIIEKTVWPMYLFIPFGTESQTKLYDRLKENIYIKIVHFNKQDFQGFKFLQYKLWKSGLSVPILMNVLIAALYLTINMGYKQVYLLGAENSWFKSLEITDDNVLYLFHGLCYAKDQIEKIALYSKDGVTPVKVHEILYNIFLGAREHHRVQEYAKKRGCNIVNITPNSFIDAYPKELD